MSVKRIWGEAVVSAQVDFPVSEEIIIQCPAVSFLHVKGTGRHVLDEQSGFTLSFLNRCQLMQFTYDFLFHLNALRLYI